MRSIQKFLLSMKHAQTLNGKTFPRTNCSKISSNTLKIGDRASISRRFSAEDVQTFADLSGDHNPIHLDEDYAAQTRYKQRIVHGVLAVGLLSGLLGTQLPGPGSVILSYQMKFSAPVYIEEDVTAEVQVLDIVGRKVTFDMTCTVKQSKKVVCSGTSQLLVPRDRISTISHLSST